MLQILAEDLAQAEQLQTNKQTDRGRREQRHNTQKSRQAVNQTQPTKQVAKYSRIDEQID